MSTDLGVAAPPVVAPPPVQPPPTPVRPDIVIDGELAIPGSVVDLESFRGWMRSDRWPGRVRLGYLAGTLWVDRTMEQAYTHNDVKTEFATVLRALLRLSGQGRYFGDGMFLSNPGAQLSTVPDGLFISFAALESGLVREVAGEKTGVVEFEGSPEMVLEVVGNSSVEKDMVLLPGLYHQAGIQEYWRADVRSEVKFEILRRGETGYVPAQEADGWWRSEVLAHAFRLVQHADARGRPYFILEERP